MSRLVLEVPRADQGITVYEAKKADSDGYLGRVAKYVPSEIMALYLPLVRFIDSSATSESAPLRASLYALSFLVFLVLTPVYFTKVAKPVDAVSVQRVVSTVAFVFWS